MLAVAAVVLLALTAEGNRGGEGVELIPSAEVNAGLSLLQADYEVIMEQPPADAVGVANGQAAAAICPELSVEAKALVGVVLYGLSVKKAGVPLQTWPALSCELQLDADLRLRYDAQTKRWVPLKPQYYVRGVGWQTARGRSRTRTQSSLSENLGSEAKQDGSVWGGAGADESSAAACCVSEYACRAGMHAAAHTAAHRCRSGWSLRVSRVSRLSGTAVPSAVLKRALNGLLGSGFLRNFICRRVPPELGDMLRHSACDGSGRYL